MLFPSAHTILLIDKAQEGENFISRQVFDGATDENAVQVSAVIGAKVAADPDGGQRAARCLQRPGWRVRLAFFPADTERRKAGLRARHASCSTTACRATC